MRQELELTPELLSEAFLYLRRQKLEKPPEQLQNLPLGAWVEIKELLENLEWEKEHSRVH
jgi:hypothetical protein